MRHAHAATLSHPVARALFARLSLAPSASLRAAPGRRARALALRHVRRACPRDEVRTFRHLLDLATFVPLGEVTP